MRNRSIPPWLAALLASACLSASSQAQTQDIRRIHHEFRLTLGDQHVQITMRVEGLKRDRLTVAMPAWKPGSYRMIHFGKQRTRSARRSKPS